MIQYKCSCFCLESHCNGQMRTLSRNSSKTLYHNTQYLLNLMSCTQLLWVYGICQGLPSDILNIYIIIYLNGQYRLYTWYFIKYVKKFDGFFNMCCPFICCVTHMSLYDLYLYLHPFEVSGSPQTPCFVLGVHIKTTLATPLEPWYEWQNSPKRGMSVRKSRD